MGASRRAWTMRWRTWWRWGCCHQSLSGGMNCSPAIWLCRGWQPPVRRNPPRPPVLWWRAPAAAKVGTICLQAMRRRGKASTNDGRPLWNNMGKLKMVSEGERVPNAPLEGVNGQTFTLERYAGRPLVLYFYPKADTPGCTNEAKDFSALKDELRTEERRGGKEGGRTVKI